MSTRTLHPPEGYLFTASLSLLAMGAHDPCVRWVDGEFWYATGTPAGPGTLRLTGRGGTLTATGYGPGADWLLVHADAVAGLRDEPGAFADLAAAHPLVAQLARTHHGLRLPATGQVFPRLLRAVLEQKVTGQEAFRAYAATVRRFGTPAPGPLPGLWAPPEAAVIAGVPYWSLHPFGVEQRRALTLRRAAAEAARLDRCVDSAEAARRLTAIPGIGPWTAAEVVRTVYGDADAVSVGDYHLPNLVAWSLAGQARADDARMLELLEPFRGHRGRVCLLLALGGRHAPRFGPRLAPRSFARF